MMCALLLYAYCCGMRSSRRIEAACRTDAAFRVICGGLVPDHATIARFVVDQEQALEGLFVSGLRLCAAAGLVDLSVVALDGTKMAADAALDRNRDAAWIRSRGRQAAGRDGGRGSGRRPRERLRWRAWTRRPPASWSARAGGWRRLQAALAVIEAEDGRRGRGRARAGAAAREAARDGRKLRGRKPNDPAAALARARAEHQAALARAEAKQAARAAKRGGRRRRAGRKLGGFAPGPDRALAARRRPRWPPPSRPPQRRAAARPAGPT